MRTPRRKLTEVERWTVYTTGGARCGYIQLDRTDPARPFAAHLDAPYFPFGSNTLLGRYKTIWAAGRAVRMRIDRQERDRQ